ncbi:MAG TPA: GNAT family N-acetyltransferase [Gaiellaceae bacterium]|nr:GNAT family N-acetyltransferase [Gaiellaceae bacterium]
MEIVEARGADLPEVRRLFREYEAGLGVDLRFQGFDEEVAGLPGAYAPPGGGLLVLRGADGLAGCVAFRSHAADICEMKRLYVRPAARGSGAGRALAEAVVAAAHVAGYERMRLDTLPEMTAAPPLYESLGFRDIEPYYDSPVAGTRFLELEL